MRIAGSRNLALAVGVGLCAAMGAAEETRLLRFPDIHANVLVFSHGGDLYRASIHGGVATRLTDLPGEEILPRFSPDGRWIAFTADAEGNKDVYVVPASGGTPRRLTFHPADEWVVDWHPDGTRIVFRSNASSFLPKINRLHIVPFRGGMVQVMELPEADLAGYDDAGGTLAFCPTRSDALVRGYRGGAVPEIWTFDLAARTSERLLSDGSVNHHPVWIGNRIYFVSDKGDERQSNLWAYDTAAGKARQVTFFREWPVRWPSKGGGLIVFENEGRLAIFDDRRGTVRAVNIEIRRAGDPSDAAEVDVRRLVSGAPALSPDGRKVILSARGDLFLLEPDRGVTRNLTRTPGASERRPQWNPAGGSFAYVSDATGEDQIYVSGEGADTAPVQVSRCGVGRIGSLSWSPDGRMIGFSDHRASYHVLDVETHVAKKIFFNAYQGSIPFATASWSPDSRWLAYTLGGPSWFASVYLYSLDQDRSFRVTDGSVSASEPQFDPAGRYLYWVADGKVNVEDSYWDGEHHRVNPSIIVAATLRREAPAPFGPEAGDAGTVAPPSPVRIDLEGLGERIVPLPVEDSSYDGLRAVEGGLIYRSSPSAGGSSYKLLDLASGKETTLLPDAFHLVPAARSSRAAYRSDSGIGLLELRTGETAGDAPLDLSGLRARLDRRLEWNEIFQDSWRILRDFFFDDGMRGVDWAAVRSKYEPLLPHVASRQELSRLLEEMFAELGHSHIEISGGDLPVAANRGHGLLGIDLAPDPATRLYRIARIYRGWNGDPDWTSPMTLPGMNVKEGDFLLAIDGTELREGVNPDELLLGKAGREVVLTVHSGPSLEGARRLTVKPAAYTESGGDRLRYIDWVTRNREAVARASGGRIGYIHLADTYVPGVAQFFRQAYPQLDKEGLILDLRFNGGGYSPVWMIDRLSRPVIFRSRLPHGKAPILEPDPVFPGIKACLVNESVESSGETFAAMFRQRGIGPIIGRRTAGALASTGGMRLVDGGVLVYPAEGKGTIENEGVAPDIEVRNLPEETISGVDRELERAVTELMQRLPDLT
jgi:tricorn protease